MENTEMRQVLEDLSKGKISVDEAMLQVKKEPILDIGIAALDTQRGVRQGTSEVIYGAGKTADQINKISKALWENGQKTILITRLSEDRTGRRKNSSEEGRLYSGSNRRNQRYSCGRRGCTDRRNPWKPCETCL